MSYQVNGTVDTPEPNYSHTEPVGPVNIGPVSDGGSKRVGIGVFQNTGNVSQTVTVQAVNPVNCAVEDMQFEQGFNRLGHSVTLIPNQDIQLFATVHAADLTPLDGDQPLSFDIATTWTY